MKPFLAALALSAAVLAPAVAHAAAPATAPAADGQIEKLVTLILPDEAVSRVAGRAFDAGLDQRIAGDPRRQAAYAADPAMRQQVSGALKARYTMIVLGALPDLRTQIGAILKGELTPGEIADTIIFFSSSAGQKVRAQAYASMGSASGRSQDQLQQDAINAAMAQMTTADFPALMTFAGSSAAQKMGSVNPKIAATSRAWADGLFVANSASLAALADKLDADYLAKKGAK